MSPTLSLNATHAGMIRSFRLTASGSAADGTGTPERLAIGSNAQNPQAFSPDGSRLVVTHQTTNTFDLGVLPLDGQSRMVPLVQTPFSEISADISPDGRWVAYQSNESGEDEVYVRCNSAGTRRAASWASVAAGFRHRTQSKNFPVFSFQVFSIYVASLLR